MEAYEKQNIKILVLDEWGEIKKIYGVVPRSDVEALIEAAEKFDLLCLSGIDTQRDTYFNHDQSVEILKKELTDLRKVGIINLKLLKIIEDGATFVKKEDGWIYLKIEKAS